MVSFIEKPITVNIAAIKYWSISSGKGTTFLRKLNTASVTSTSCRNDTMVHNEYLESRQRLKIYRQIMIIEMIVAFSAPCFRSSEIEGNTFCDARLYFAWN